MSSRCGLRCPARTAQSIPVCPSALSVGIGRLMGPLAIRAIEVPACCRRASTKPGAVRVCADYKTPAAVPARKDSSSIFKSGTLVGDIWYAYANTESPDTPL
jgi:hypothetical protein